MVRRLVYSCLAKGEGLFLYFPVFIVFEGDVPYRAAVLHER
jgi:hypothetical protein